MNFIDYATTNRLALFPCAAGTKRPILKWKEGSTTDAAQWQIWRAEGHNLAIDCAKSGIIAIDVDVSKVTREEAWNAYCRLCISWGLSAMALPAAMTQSARDGWHIPFKRPDGSDAADFRGGGTLVKISDTRPLADGEQDGEVIGFKNRGYVIAPGSTVVTDEGSKPYLLMPDAPAPHQMPEAMCAALRLPVIERTIAHGPSGESALLDVASLVAFLDSHQVFDAEPDWFAALGAIKLALGDTEEGLMVARQITREDASEEAMMARWNRHASSPAEKPNVRLYTIGSLIDMAAKLGRKFHVGRSASAMFGSLAMLPSPPISPGAIPMIGGRGQAQAEAWAPILAEVLSLPRLPTHPEMPDIGHPLRATINAAIPGIAATRSTDALAVLEAVHPATAAEVGDITPAVKARAEALRQDVERALAPDDYVRDHRGDIQRDNIDNFAFFLRSLDVAVRYNEWTERVELRGWVWRDWSEIGDAMVARLRMRAGQTGSRYVPSKDFTWDALLSLAHDNTVDPARERLDVLQSGWDGNSRLHAWLSQACGVAYDSYHQAVGTTIMLGLVARIRCPGIKFDLMPVFVSERQGTAKSTLARMLAIDDQWFVENVALGESAKELILLLGGKAVAEISEMRTHGEADAVKAMISATHDEGRPAYGRATIKRPRRNIFVGTTNRPEFLEDPSGGRRFLPVMVRGEINLDFMREHLPQLVGEAATLQARGADINLPREVWALAGEHQAAATTMSSSDVLLDDWFRGDAPMWISSANLVLLLRQAIGRDPARASYTAAMRRLGFINKTRRTDEGVLRVWMRGEPERDAPGYAATLSYSGRPALQLLAPPPAPIRNDG